MSEKVQNADTDKQVLQILSGVVEKPKPKPPQQQAKTVISCVISAFNPSQERRSYSGCFRPAFVRPCSNFVRPRVFAQEMNQAQSVMQQLIDEARMSPEQIQQIEQAQSAEQEPKKKHQLGEEMFPAKVPGMKNDSFGSMEDLRKSRP